MSDPPIDITKHPRFRGRQPGDEEKRRGIQRKSQQRFANDAELGRQAFAALSAWREKLTPADREAIARSLWPEVDNYYINHPGEAKYLLLTKADPKRANSTKELERLVLKPGKPYRPDLYATASKYADLMRALADGESIDELAHRVLFGTSFYPRQADAPIPAINEAQLIFDALIMAANRVDAEFHLFDQCLEVARLREEVESDYWHHFVEKGLTLNSEEWLTLVSDLKLLPDAWPGTDMQLSEETGHLWPLDDWRLVEWEKLKTVPANAFWAKNDATNDPFSAVVRSAPDFFFFPHVYLGPTLNEVLLPHDYFKDPQKVMGAGWTKEEAYHELPDLPMPQVQWHETTHQYSLRDQGPNYVDDLCPKAAHWLVLYPDPHLKRLVPMIYAMGEFPGAELTPITAPMIASFGDPKHWQYFGKDANTLLARLKDLTGYRTGKFDVYEAWRETAARFHWNPVLRNHHNTVDEMQYRQHLRQWLKAAQGDVGRSDEED